MLKEHTSFLFFKVKCALDVSQLFWRDSRPLVSDVQVPVTDQVEQFEGQCQEGATQQVAERRQVGN